MPVVGDRVVIAGTKVGQQRREGNLVAVVGRMIKVRWTDGTESLLTPAPGSVTFTSDPGGNGGTGRRTAAQKARPAKPAPSAKRASPAAKGGSKPIAKGGTKAQSTVKKTKTAKRETKPAARTQKQAKPAAKKAGAKRR